MYICISSAVFMSHRAWMIDKRTRGLLVFVQKGMKKPQDKGIMNGADHSVLQEEKVWEQVA